ncbi:MAG: NUDIX domain-containing protein [Bdellovibrionota bacterium]
MSHELIEIFNSDGLLVGTRDRKDVHSLGLWHRGVHGFLFDHRGRLLIQKRSEHCDTFPNVYDCSISEHLSVGETFKQALTRGCNEELDLSEIHSEKILSYKMAYGPTDNMICELHTAQIESNEINFNKAEVAAIDFVEIDSLLELATQKPAQFTSWFQQQLLWYSKKSHKLIIT